MRTPKLIAKFLDRLPPDARYLLEQLLRVCDERNRAAYLVGGPLRDLLLNRPSLDIDIAVEGNAPALARELATVIGGRAVVHPAFLTATVSARGSHIDVITARSETYARPGALPTVRAASIHEDLLRRDFTVNALALGLTGPDTGTILDTAGGRADLATRLIRVLHERSFQDDATRILRAFRYAARLSFEVEPETLAWLKRDLGYLDTMSGARLHHELTRILAEDKPEDILLALNNVGALAAIHPAFRFDHDRAEAFARLRDLHLAAARAAYWPALAWHLSEDDDAGIARHLAATRRQREAMLAIPALHTVEPNLARPTIKRSAVAEMLEPFPLPALWALAALTEHSTVRERIHDYLTKARYERPHITGDDLIALGVPAGPQVGEILRRLTAARLDHEVTSREDEERLVRALIARGGKVDQRTRQTARSRSS